MRYLVVAYVFLLFYTIGALTIENNVNYDTWRYISPADFKDYHQRLEVLLGWHMFIPMGTALILNVVLIFVKSLRPNRWVVICSAVLFSFIVAFSLAIQVPLHQELAANFNERDLNQLIRNHNLIRLPATIALMLINVLLLLRLLRNNQAVRDPEI
ncbi:hypothetical protein [Parapedobacter pyrenivorans]|uniref:hypothetical protein n=1 Tax=Parapedobacter pyrenivorans TaxID=1305674 RepID=UPI0016698A2A|nr:hypothetical protein [Parapedobacter pyrenivorans]